MNFRIYKGETVITEGESPLSITGIAPNTAVSSGDYEVVRIDGERESERVDIPSFETLPIEVTDVNLSHSTMTLNEGETESLTASVAPDNATDKTIRFTTSDRDIATVSASGDTRTITGVKDGTATITARSGDEVSATCIVTVNEPEPEIPDPEPEPEEGD